MSKPSEWDKLDLFDDCAVEDYVRSHAYNSWELSDVVDVGGSAYWVHEAFKRGRAAGIARAIEIIETPVGRWPNALTTDIADVIRALAEKGEV